MSIGNPKAVASSEAPLLELVLRPHRSLSHAGFQVLMYGVIIVNMLGAIAFTWVGAWPMLPFFGLDIAVFWWAFRANYKAATAFEVVRIDYEAVTLTRVSAEGRRRQVTFPVLWSRLEIDRGNDDRQPTLKFCHRHESFALAQDLPPAERLEIGQLLQRSLADARRGRHFS